MRGYLYNLKRYGSFSHKEISHFLITAILVAFFFSFNDWGYITEAGEPVIDYALGVGNLLTATFAMLLILGLVIVAQKLVSTLR